MNHGDLTAKVAPSLESVHEVKLEALLHDLLRKEGRLQAARTLGVNYKTVALSIDSGRLLVHAGDPHEVAARTARRRRI